MGINTVKVSYITCDICHILYLDGNSEIPSLPYLFFNTYRNKKINEAIKEGWLIDSAQCLCPSCVKGREKASAINTLLDK